MPEKRTIEISFGFVFRTVLILIALWFLYLVRDVVAMLFISILLVSAMEPAVNWFQKKKIPRSLGVLIVYIILITIISISISFLIPPMVSQFKDFSQKLPEYSQNLEKLLGEVKIFFASQNVTFSTQTFFGNLAEKISSLSGGIFSTTLGIFSGFINVFIVIVMAFYMSSKEDGIKKFVVSITPDKHKEYAASVTDRIRINIGKWVQGQLVLMLIIFLLDFFGLYLLGIPYALTLAIFAGLMEIIPYIGPVISAIPGVVLGFLISPTVGFLTLLMYIIAQQFENHIIVPQIMKKALGLNPVAIILALLVGAKLGGALGAILAIPVATAVSVFISDLMKDNSSQPTQ